MAGPSETAPTSGAKLPLHFAASFSYSAPSSTAAVRRSPRLAAPQPPPPPPPPPRDPLRSSPLKRVAPQTKREPDPPPLLRSPSPSRSSSPSASPRKKRKRIRRGIDDPSSAQGSRYASYQGVPDHLSPSLDVLFCGINPGLTSSLTHHHFAHATNHFYPSLHLSGLTAHRLLPTHDATLPTLRPYRLGLTNLAGRPTAESSELTRAELHRAVLPLLRKASTWKPRTVAFVGKGIGKVVESRIAKSSSAAATATVAVGERVRVRLPKDTLLSSHPPGMEPPVRQPRPTVWRKSDEKDDTGYGIMPFLLLHSNRQNTTTTTTTTPADRTDSPSAKPHPQAPRLIEPNEATFFFVSPSTSARVTTHFLHDKARVLAKLREVVAFFQREEQARNGDEEKVEAEEEKERWKWVEFSVVDLDRLEWQDEEVERKGKGEREKGRAGDGQGAGRGEGEVTPKVEADSGPIG